MNRDRPAWWSRRLHRLVHLVLGSLLGVYLYSPLGDSQAVTLFVQAVVFPCIVLSGLLLWRGPRLYRRLASGRRQADGDGG